VKRLILLLTVVAALFMFAPSSQADPYYCDRAEVFSLIEDAVACGGSAGLWWRWDGGFWDDQCSTYGARRVKFYAPGGYFADQICTYRY
jgi:hypothetical protein